jgi:hypothetical protein
MYFYMNKLVVLLLVVSATMVYGQNKTLGVGTPTPNPNAALHVESPTNNQGFIMPRLTSAQRTSMGAALTAVDEGVMVYDTDLKAIQIWSGSAWLGLAKLQYPYKDSVITATGTPDLFALKYNNAENKRLLRVESLNPANGSSAVSVQQNGTGIGVFSRVDNPTAGTTALYGTTNSNLGGPLAPVGVYGESTGTGSLAAAFRVNNTGNTFPAVYAETNGSGPTIRARNIGSADGIAGLFSNDSSSNTYPAVQAGTQGPGSGVRVIQDATSVGSGMDVFMQNPLSTASGLAVTQEGLGDGVLVNVNTVDTTYMAGIRSTNNSFGNAGIFTTTNPNSPSPAVVAISNSLNGPLEAIQSGPTGPIARLFMNDAANNSDGIIINQTGTGNAIVANRPVVASAFIGDGSGLTNLPPLSLPFSSTVNSPAPLFDVYASGTTASAARFTNTDPANTSPALFAQTDGTDAAIVGQTFTGFASIYGRREGATNGNAGFFEITDAANIAPALQTTTVGSGPAGSFLLNRPGSVAHALYAQSNGDSTYAALHGNNVGNGFGVFGKSAGSRFASAAVYGEHVGVGDAAGAFRINNASNAYAALYGETNGTGSALYANNLGAVGRGAQIQINNASNPNAAVRGFTNGLGNAGFFTINNVANDSSALYITTNGTGNAITANAPIQATQFIGDGSGLTNLPALSFPTNFTNTTSPNNSRLLDLETNSSIPTDSVYVARFRNNNPGAYSDILSVINMGQGAGGYFQMGDVVNNTGTGAAVFAAQNGLGRAGQFQIQNASNTQPAIRSYTNGTGRAAWFTINNAANDSPAMFAQTDGIGPAVYGLNTGPGDSFSPAGHFVVNNPTNTHAAVQGNNDGNGPAGRFLIESATNTAFAVDASTIGTGSAGSFNISNPANSAAAVIGVTNGTGIAVSGVNNGTGYGVYARAVGTTDAMYAIKESTDGTGSAGNFQNNNGGNNASALFANTNAAGGSAIGAINSANGNAFSIFQGGMKVSTQVLDASVNTVIGTRATAYLITNASLSFTFSGGVSFDEGDMIYIFNSDTVNADIDGFTLAVDNGVVGIYMGGALRFFAYTAP